MVNSVTHNPADYRAPIDVRENAECIQKYSSCNGVSYEKVTTVQWYRVVNGSIMNYVLPELRFPEGLVKTEEVVRKFGFGKKYDKLTAYVYQDNKGNCYLQEKTVKWYHFNQSTGHMHCEILPNKSCLNSLGNPDFYRLKYDKLSPSLAKRYLLAPLEFKTNGTSTKVYQNNSNDYYKQIIDVQWYRYSPYRSPSRPYYNCVCPENTENLRQTKRDIGAYDFNLGRRLDTHEYISSTGVKYKQQKTVKWLKWNPSTRNWMPSDQSPDKRALKRMKNKPVAPQPPSYRRVPPAPRPMPQPLSSLSTLLAASPLQLPMAKEGSEQTLELSD